MREIDTGPTGTFIRNIIQSNSMAGKYIVCAHPAMTGDCILAAEEIGVYIDPTTRCLSQNPPSNSPKRYNGDEFWDNPGHQQGVRCLQVEPAKSRIIVRERRIADPAVVCGRSDD